MHVLEPGMWAVDAKRRARRPRDQGFILGRWDSAGSTIVFRDKRRGAHLLIAPDVTTPP